KVLFSWHALSEGGASVVSGNYGGVYVGLPSDAAAMVSSQTKTASKGIERLCTAFLPLSWLNFIW
uniref:Uncharacterized protein n=1 Tax=Meleagris gallopavo TaxID=9103 RepID=A0A803YBA2_MELGA